MALARFQQKTYLQVNLLIEDDDSARAVSNILYGIENIIYVLSIFSLMVLWSFEFIDHCFEQVSFNIKSFTVAWGLGYFQVYLAILVIRLLGGEAWHNLVKLYGFRLS